MPPVPRPMRPARPRAGARVAPARRAGKITFGVLNFKSIASAQLLPRRVTVIAGSNSSGKSSLLQALLFAAQSFGEPTPVINGDLVRLGEAKDVIRNGMEETTLEFSYIDVIREGPREPPQESPRSLRVTLTPRDEGRSLAAHEFSLWQGDECLIRAVRDGDPPDGLPRAEEEQALRLRDPGRLKLPAESYLVIAGITPTRLAYEADETSLRVGFEEALASGRSPNRGWPLEEILRVARNTADDEAIANRLGELMHRAEEDDLDVLSEADRDLLFGAFCAVEAPEGWFSEPVVAPGRGRALFGVRHEREDGLTPVSLAFDIGRGIDQVERLATAVLYLGPLRDDPRVAYPLGHTVSALPVGEKGEFTAAYLRENRTARLPYGTPQGNQVQAYLPAAVNQWCTYLGIAERIEVKTQGKLGHVLDLRVGGHYRDPTAIGVGASQLLPVVVLVLGAPEGSIVLLEQPELHLHPGVQSRLADFLAFARRDIRIVVETHSEYLLTRLRLRVAEDEIDPETLAVLFATQQPDEEEGKKASLHTQFEHLSVDELGDFDHWPQDFFDSLDHDSVAIARAIARRLEAREGEHS